MDAETTPLSDQDRPLRFCIVQDHTPEAAAVYFAHLAIEMGFAEHGGVDEDGEIILEPVTHIVTEVADPHCLGCRLQRWFRQRLIRHRALRSD